MEQEKIKIYIDDLLKENQCLFAMNEDIQTKRKELQRKLIELTNGFGTEQEMKEMGALCGRLLGMAMIYRQNRKDIMKNMALIRGLKNGTIKEI